MADEDAEYVFEFGVEEEDETSEDAIEFVADSSEFLAFLDEDEPKALPEHVMGGASHAPAASPTPVSEKSGEKKEESAAREQERKAHKARLRAKVAAGRTHAEPVQRLPGHGGVGKSGNPSTVEQRRLGERPCMKDLETAVFSNSSRFSTKETVLVSRSRGGFVYGAIEGHRKPEQCCYDPSVAHSYYQWRVLYKTFRGKSMVKDVPSAFLGKLTSSAPVAALVVQQQTATDTAAARGLGEPVAKRDLYNVRLSSKGDFKRGEMVLVPRSRGGWSYAVVAGPMPVTCMLPRDKSKRHQVKGYRVYMDQNRTVKKELVQGCIGKLPIIDNTPALQRGRGIVQVGGIDNAPTYSGSATHGGTKATHGGTKGHGITRKQLEKEFEQQNSDMGPLVSEASSSYSAHPKKKEQQRKAEEPRLPQVVYDSSELRHQEEDIEEVEGEEILWRPPGAVANTNKAATKQNSDEGEESGEKGGSEEEEEEEEDDGLLDAPTRGPRRGMLSVHVAGSEAGKSKPKSKPKPKRRKKHLIVVDVPNVAMNHGKHAMFSTEGVRLCFNYWEGRGHEVIGFMPEHYLNRKPNPNAKTTMADHLERVDNPELLRQYVEEGKLVLTPSWNYDDSYCIQYAKLNNGVIVTKDRFNDHIDKAQEEKRGRVRYWLRQHCVSFAFAGSCFMPDPDFEFPKPYQGKK